MQQVFENGNERDGRTILIKIENGSIAFYFYEKYVKQTEWIQQEEERRKESGEYGLTDDEKSNSEFYWIRIDDWRNDANNFHEHMREKTWFTEEMEKYMDKNTNTKTI